MPRPPKTSPMGEVFGGRGMRMHIFGSEIMDLIVYGKGFDTEARGSYGGPYREDGFFMIEALISPPEF